MKTIVSRAFFCGWLGLAGAAAAADAPVLRYEVVFKDAVVATQTLTIAESENQKTVATFFEADLPVFTVLQHYSERLSATFRTDGAVERLDAVLIDGPLRTEIAGFPLTNGILRIVRTDRSGVSTNDIAREDYDFNSLALYGTAPTAFLTTNSPQRVLSVAEGIVEPVSIQAITESDTFERQHLVSTHLVWTTGAFTSHSWHPERFSNLPRRYVRQTENGEFTFNLLR